MRKQILFFYAFLLATVTVMAQPTGQLYQFFPTGLTAEDYFGMSVDVDGNYAVVGAYKDDDNGTDSGAAWVYKYENGTWFQMSKLVPTDPAAEDFFGYSVSISGDYIIVGAPQDDDKGTDSGSAYIFNFSGGVWYQFAKLTGSTSNTGDNFGCAVAINDVHAIVGARYDDNMGQNSGTAFIFRHESGWNQESVLTAPDGTLYDYFGTAVDVYGNYAIVGAYMNDGVNADEGSAYIYKRIGTNSWQLQNTMAPGDLGNLSRMGISVAINGEYAFAGAIGDDTEAADAGAIYVYKNNGLLYEFEAWDYHSKITADDATEYDNFGRSLSTDGTRLLVGAHMENNNGIAAGASYLFALSGDDWIQQTKVLPADGMSNDFFGNSCAIAGEHIIAGAYGDRDDGDFTGSAYFFDENQGGTGNWGLVTKKLPNNGAANDVFGTTIDGNDDFAFVGAQNEDVGGTDVGALYIYERMGTEWEQVSRFLPADITAGSKFGNGLAVAGDYLFVGATGNLGKGSVYVLKNVAGTWTQYAKLTASDGEASDYFGSPIYAEGDYVIIGALGDDDRGSNSGAAYIFKNNAGTWTEQTKLTAYDGISLDSYGASVGISGDYAIVGSHQDDDNGINSGSLYVYKNIAGTWTFDVKLKPSDGAANDFFAKSAKISGNYIIASSYADDDSGSSTGSVYFFYNNSGTWSQVQKVHSSEMAASQSFGFCVDIDGDYALAGSITSSAYLFYNNAGTWEQTSILRPLDYGITSGFAKSFTLRGDYAFIGAGTSGISGLNSGAAYVFGAMAPVIYSQPLDVTEACANDNSEFHVSAGGVSTYQWQISTDGGLNFSDIAESGAFVGTNSSSLIVSGTPLYNNTYFRCVCSGSLGTITSDAAFFSLETTVPVIESVPSTQTVYCDEGCNTAYPDYTSMVVATDNCDPFLIITQSPTPGTGLGAASNTVTITVSDHAGNYAQQTFTVLKVDNIDPYFTSVHNDVVLTGNSSCQATLPDYRSSASVADNCTETFTVTQSPAPGTTISGATNTITLSVSDNSGNTASVNFNASVSDILAPVITSSHSSKIISAGVTCQAQLPDYTSELTYTENCCGAVIVTQDPVAGTWISGDMNVVTLYAADGAGNQSSVAFNVSVEDNSAPQIITVLSDVTLNGDNTCYAALPDYASTILASDNCDNNPVVTQSPVAGTQISGSVNTITITVTDADGNTTVSGFNAQVIDVIDPVFTNTISNQNVTADENCMSVMPDFRSMANVSDNCDNDLTLSQIPVPGTTISSHTNLTRIIATDDMGNNSEISFFTIIQDETAPIITSTHPSVVLSDEFDCMATLPDYTNDVVASDYCDPFLTIAQIPAAGTTVSGSDNLVTLQVTDDAGNFSTVSFNVAVQDNSAPVITSVHNDQTLDAVADCGASLPDYTSAVEATDNCDSNLAIEQSPIAGTMVYGTSNLVTITVSDGTGNSIQTSFNISVVDNSAPQIANAPLSDEISAGEECSGLVPDYTTIVVVSDNCDNAPSLSQQPAPGTSVQGSENTITLTAEDSNGLVTIVSFNLAVVDHEMPLILCHDDITLTAAEGESFYNVNSDMLDPVSVTDNCGILNYFNDFNENTTLSGAQLPLGETIIVWRTEDNSGNTAECSFTVTVNAFVGTSNTITDLVSVYPNPTNGIVYVSGLENGNVTITDMAGRIVAETTSDGSETVVFDLSDYQPGVYFINAKTLDGIKNFKIVLE
jgi:hypothetical protein